MDKATERLADAKCPTCGQKMDPAIVAAGVEAVRQAFQTLGQVFHQIVEAFEVFQRAVQHAEDCQYCGMPPSSAHGPACPTIDPKFSAARAAFDEVWQRPAGDTTDEPLPVVAARQ